MEFSAESLAQVFHFSNLNDRKLVVLGIPAAILELVLHSFQLILPSIINSFHPRSRKIRIFSGRLERAPMEPGLLVVAIILIAKILALLPTTLAGEVVIFK